MLVLKNIILNRPLFVILMAIFGIFVLTLLVYCSAFIPPKINDMIMFPLDRPTIEFPMEINVVEGDFNKQQQDILVKCADTWRDKTNGLVDIRFNLNWKAPTPFSEYNYLNYGKKTIWLRDSNEREILLLQLKSNLNADGISRGDFIVVMNDFNSVGKDDNKLFVIVMHELSHQLGFEHLKPQFPALMNPGGNNGQITANDLLIICSRYNCKK